MGVRLGVDVGGTFTDLAGVVDGRVVLAKVPSVPADQAQGVLAVLERSGVDPALVDVLAHGSTVATNALLERRGGRTALVTTVGFRDILEIGRQDRPALYDLTRDRPPALVPRSLRFVVRERCGPSGVLRPLDEGSVRAVAQRLREAHVESVAVCLLFSFLHPAHEQRVGEILRELLPGVPIVLSSEVLPEFREYERTSTTVADAYLGPRLSSYLHSLAAGAHRIGLTSPLVMQSSGGVIDLPAAAAHGARCVLSGPAGGVVGAAYVAGLSGVSDLLTFDMGGTSTDVAVVLDGRVQTTAEAVIAGVPLKLPMVDVHSVSAGGGSIAWVDEGGVLRVGPVSAGAEPGPAAYQRGGELPTVTDADLHLGYLPDGARLGGDVMLTAGAAGRALERLGDSVGLSVDEVAAGVVAVADAEMVRALRVMTVERGIDPRGLALVAFGGAGGLHACALAEELGMTRVLVPYASGVLSALGLAVSDLRRDYSRTHFASLAELTADIVEEEFAELAAIADRDLPGATLSRAADCRYVGQSFELTVPMTNGSDPDGLVPALAAAFGAAHERRYGYRMDDEPVELVALRLTATISGERPQISAPAADPAARRSRRRAWVDGGWSEVDVLPRAALGAGDRLIGPAIVEYGEATCLVRPGWQGRIDDVGTLVLTRAAVSVATRVDPRTERFDPVTLSVLTSALEGVATEMGSTLVRGAYSSNIKERRDCSAAVFDSDGRLVAQAAHIPVHLGAMPESVRAVIEAGAEPGDVWALNDPFTGGNHLPDVTLVSPFTAGGEEIVGYAATRAHHSDMGGMRPGSMPADSREIYQEGLIIPPVRLIRRGRFVEDVLALILANSRTPELRRGDFRAQVAANRLAETRLHEMMARHGRDVVLNAFTEVRRYAERRSRQVLAALPDGRYEATGEIEGDGTTDDDLPIRVAVTIDGDRMEIDFIGTAPAAMGNVNCPLAVTRSACCFALRVLLPEDVPANAGTYAPLSVIAPEGTLINARRPAAVVAGNVETSQRIADTVLLALSAAADLPAQGQGTMNNLVIGGSGWTYYETLAGGQGASSTGPGPSAVHVGMTNTRNTPVEALEMEYPLRVRRYEIADGSGGAGQHRGGDGLIREIEILQPASVSLLTDRRRHSPAGANGGGHGRTGSNRLDEKPLPPKVSQDVGSGAVVTIETPGGGGWGRPAP